MKNSIISMLFIAFGLMACSESSADSTAKASENAKAISSVDSSANTNEKPTAKARSGLILSKEGIKKIQADLGSIPLFDSTLERLQQEVDAEIAKGIETPIPKDFSGGYTHQKHKSNFFMLQKAGVLFQILEDEKYANYIRDMFFQYEAMYKDLPLHPQTRSYARGKTFLAKPE